MSAKLGISIPNVYLSPGSDWSHIGSYIDEIERWRFDSAWVLERIFHSIPILEPLTVLAYAAARTKTIRLGTAIIMSALRSPVLFAKSTSTLDFLSGGRLILGLALGNNAKEYQACGVPMNQRVGRFVESIKIVKKLWSEPSVSYDGKYWKISDATIYPRPIQKPHPMILIGGRAEGVFRRAARWGDGWIAGGGTAVEDVRDGIQKVKGYAMKYGKDPRELRFGKLLYVNVDSNRERAREGLAGGLMRYYGEALPKFIDIDKACAYGSSDDCSKRIEEFAEAGVQEFVLTPVTSDLKQLRAIGDSILPRFR